MPNFHYNYLAIAANEEDMRKVLTSMVNNLRTKKKLICRVDLDGYDPNEADGYSPRTCTASSKTRLSASTASRSSPTRRRLRIAETTAGSCPITAVTAG